MYDLVLVCSVCMEYGICMDRQQYYDFPDEKSNFHCRTKMTQTLTQYVAITISHAYNRSILASLRKCCVDRVLSV